jgi:hypothetical protein
MTIVGLLAIALLTVNVPAEGSDRVSRGEAEAVLHAFGTGGFAIMHHQTVGTGAPADSELRASIRPFSGSPWDGRHFCAEDWHVLLIAVIAGGDSSYHMPDAMTELNPVVVQLFLDGVPLPSSRTSIKRFLSPERFQLVNAFYFQQGAILAPSALTVGSHTAKYIMTDLTGTDSDQITFFVDAPNSGACV